MSTNMEIWNKVKSPPGWAKREIKFGALKGKTDINPQWRFMAMTEAFGPVGFGWTYSIDDLWLEKGYGDETSAFAKVSVKIKRDNQWSEPFHGIGGSSFTTKTKNGVQTSDEAYKMATTDALSVAFKAIGVAGEIYSGFDDTSKYAQAVEGQQPQQRTNGPHQAKNLANKKDIDSFIDTLTDFCADKDLDIDGWLKSNSGGKVALKDLRDGKISTHGLGVLTGALEERKAQ